jgi:hypothetical protein
MLTPSEYTTLGSMGDLARSTLILLEGRSTHTRGLFGVAGVSPIPTYRPPGFDPVQISAEAFTYVQGWYGLGALTLWELDLEHHSNHLHAQLGFSYQVVLSPSLWRMAWSLRAAKHRPSFI